MLLRNPRLGDIGGANYNSAGLMVCPAGSYNATGNATPFQNMTQWYAWVSANCRVGSAPAPVSTPVYVPPPQPTYVAPAPQPTYSAPAPVTRAAQVTAQSRDAYIPTVTEAAEAAAQGTPDTPATTTYSVVNNAPFVQSAPTSPITDDTSQAAPAVVASAASDTSPWLLIAAAAAAFLILSGKKRK